MVEKNNATCSICGKAYHICMSCRDSMALSPWKIHTDTSEHFKIYQILHGYSTGVYSKDEAKSKFQMVDLSDLDSFKENIKSIIKEILKEEVSVETDVKIEIEADDAEIKIEVEKPKSTRKKYSKVETE